MSSGTGCIRLRIRGIYGDLCSCPLRKKLVSLAKNRGILGGGVEITERRMVFFPHMNMVKYITNWKYRYFSRKLKGVKSMILDLEFKRFKTREIREEVRQTYDTSKAKLLSLETTIKQEKDKQGKGMAEGDIARLEDETVRLKRDIERYAAQIKAMDIDVEGSRETNEYPDGVAGVNQQLESLHELEGMLKDYCRAL